MALPRWDEEMKFELLRLKTELRSENFRALHTPIGLGLISKALEDESNPQNGIYPHLTNAALVMSTSTATTRANGQKAANARLPSLPSLPPLAPLPPKTASSMSRSLTKILIIHSLDVGFVVMTLGLGLLLASWLIDPDHLSENPELLKQATPIRFLLESNALTLALGLYGFFSLYWLFFKLVSGSTLGESFLDNFWSLQNPRRMPSVKDSGDS